jgi:hypothetical protein
MTAPAIDVLREVSEAGGTVRLEGDMLRLSAPEPLPDELRARLRQHKAEILALLSAEPAKDAPPEGTTVHNVAGLPQEIVDGVRAILSAERARGIPPQRWPQVRRDTARLVERGWAQQAFGLGWTTADLFGCDQRAPWYRLDRSGLVLLTGGREVVELTADVAALRTSTGSVLRFRRRPPARPPLALLWELLTAPQATGPPTAHRSGERMAATFLAGPRRHPDHDHLSEEDHGWIDSAPPVR